MYCFTYIVSALFGTKNLLEKDEINIFSLQRVGRLIHLVEHTGGARRDNLTQVSLMSTTMQASLNNEGSLLVHFIFLAAREREE